MVKTALVTGGARRIGKALVEGLAEDGWAVAIHYGSSANAADELAGQINASGGSALTVGCDLAAPDAADTIMSSVHEGLGPVSLLINSAALFEDDSATTVTAQSFDAHMALNLRAPVLLSRAFAEQLPQGVEGNIINVIDQRVRRLNPRFLSYTTAKVGLWTVTRTLAQALAPRIRVNGIGPGPTLANDRQDTADFEQQARSVLMQRGPDIAEFQRAVRFILETPSLTGQMLALDGGQHLAWETSDATGKE